jgi:hypothetical protein
MKNFTKIILSLFILLVAFSTSTHADYTETAQVIKTDKNTNDTVVIRADGKKWLIQHNRSCTSITTEFPVSLIITGDKVTDLKVNFNEKCKVYNAVLYGGEGTFVDVVKSDNQLVADHQADITWNDKKYLIDYGKGCPYLYSFAGKTIYYSGISDAGGQMVLPGAGGQCPFTFTKTLEILPPDTTTSTATVDGLQYQAQDNQVYFYWDKVTADGKWVYAISYSKFKLDLSMYKSWKEMPNVKISQTNSYTARNLGNGIPYYFYIAAMELSKDAGPWAQATVTPVAGESLKNNPDPEQFQVSMQENTDSFRLYWPMHSEARRYYLRFYVDGKLEFFKILKTDQNELIIKKDPKYLGKGLRVEVTTMPFPQNPTFSDGIYWEYKKK